LWPVTTATADVAAANLVDLASDKETAMSVDLEWWTSLKWGEWGFFDFTLI
jgi:hypothetical protein